MTKDVMIVNTNYHRLINNKLNKARIVRKPPLKSKSKSKFKSNTPPISNKYQMCDSSLDILIMGDWYIHIF